MGRLDVWAGAFDNAGAIEGRRLTKGATGALQLGRSGLKVSTVGLGCNNFGGRIDLEASRAVVHKSLDLGVTLLDTADVYGERGGSETALGQILGGRRKDLVLATKFSMPMGDAGALQGASRRYVMRAVEASLQRLRTDWIDLYKRGTPPPEGSRLSKMPALASRYLTEAHWKTVERLEQFCAERGHGLVELAFSWLATRPAVASIIAGATKPEQVEQNVRAVGWKLTVAEIGIVDALTKPA